MARRMPGSAESLQAYPNITAAAEILGVSASTLSRRADTAAERRGERDRVLPAAEVLRLGSIFRRRSLNDVAQDLVDHARDVAPQEEVERVEKEIEEFFDDRAVGNDEREEFLLLAWRLLPAGLCQQIQAVLEEQGAELPDLVRGYPPVPEG